MAPDLVELRAEADAEGVQVVDVHARVVLLAIHLLRLSGNDAHAGAVLLQSCCCPVPDLLMYGWVR